MSSPRKQWPGAANHFRKLAEGHLASAVRNFEQARKLRESDPPKAWLAVADAEIDVLRAQSALIESRGVIPNGTGEEQIRDVA